MSEWIWVLMCGINVVYDSWALMLLNHEQEILKRKNEAWLQRSFLIDVLETAQSDVELQSHGTGKYGRVLGEFYINGVNINELMVKEGHAVKYDGGKR